jgi:copper chaperone CopZ
MRHGCSNVCALEARCADRGGLVTASKSYAYDLGDLLPGTYYCAECAARVCEGVSTLPGVSASECDVEAGTLTVVYDPRAVSERDLTEAITRVAVEATDRVGHAAYRVVGLD